MMNEGTYKEKYVGEHGEAAYAEKLAKNAKWRKANPEAMAEIAAKRRRNGRSAADRVLFLGDIHLGAKTVDVDKIKALAKKYWSHNPVILMGDLIDMGVKKQMIYQNVLNPQEQLNLVEEIIKPLDIRAYVIGNHEDRIFKEVGFNPYISLFGTEPVTSLCINNREIFFNHGTSAADNSFLEHSKYSKWVSGDIIALGHSHTLAKKTVLRQGRLTTLVRTGGFLGAEYYVVKAGYQPQPKGWVEYDCSRNLVHLMAWDSETDEVFEI